MRRKHIDYERTDRVAELIQRKLAEIIQMEVKDPRLPRFVTVSAVKVSRDMAYAKVYITVLGDKSQVSETVEILNHAASYLRGALARCIKLRIVPKLIFVFDESVEYGNRLSRLIDDVNVPKNDEEE
jgi:ribosome-binding factor A